MSGDEVHYIRPVEIDGTTYRSATEARWAKFFTIARIPFEYEAQAFDLGRYRYCPDFWLCVGKVFFEVKPTIPTEREEAKAMDLVRQTGRGVVIACGPPSMTTKLLGYSHKSQRRPLYFQQEDYGKGVALVGCVETLSPEVRVSANEFESKLVTGRHCCEPLQRIERFELRNGQFVDPAAEMAELLALRTKARSRARFLEWEVRRLNDLESKYRWRIEEFEKQESRRAMSRGRGYLATNIAKATGTVWD